MKRAATRCSRARGAALVLAACGDDARPAPAGGGSTLQSTLVDPDGDGFLEPGPGEPLTDRGDAVRRSATRSSRSASSRTRTSATRSRPRGCRSWTGSARRSRPRSARRRRSPRRRSTPPSARSTARSPTPSSSPATSPTTRSATSSTSPGAVLEGDRVNPDSGDPGYRGVQQPDSADPFYYRPDFDAPAHPGALAQAQRAFTAEGLDAPFYPLVGNHDVLAQGEVPPTDAINAYAAGDELITALDPEILDQLPREEIDAQQATAALLGNQFALPSTTVPADPERRLVGPGEAERALGRTPMDYTVDLTDRVRAVLVDTVNRDGTSRARINPAQLQRLEQQLDTNRLVVVFSHNPLTAEALAGPRPPPQRRRLDRRQQPPQPHHRARRATG